MLITKDSIMNIDNWTVNCNVIRISKWETFPFNFSEKKNNPIQWSLCDNFQFYGFPFFSFKIHIFFFFFWIKKLIDETFSFLLDAFNICRNTGFKWVDSDDFQANDYEYRSTFLRIALIWKCYFSRKSANIYEG